MKILIIKCKVTMMTNEVEKIERYEVEKIEGYEGERKERERRREEKKGGIQGDKRERLVVYLIQYRG